MRKIAGVFVVVGLLFTLAAIANADPPAKTDKKKDDDAKNRADQLAQDIFSKTDKHRHGYINKYEFKRADAHLISAIKQMAGDGIIGKGKPSKDAQATIANFTDGFEAADADHDKRVTLQELTDYVSRAIAAADQAYRIQASQQPPKRRPY